MDNIQRVFSGIAKQDKMALNGSTHSEVANIKLNLNRNKWLDLLKRSVENERES